MCASNCEPSSYIYVKNIFFIFTVIRVMFNGVIVETLGRTDFNFLTVIFIRLSIIRVTPSNHRESTVSLPGPSPARIMHVRKNDLNTKKAAEVQIWTISDLSLAAQKRALTGVCIKNIDFTKPEIQNNTALLAQNFQHRLGDRVII